MTPIGPLASRKMPEHLRRHIDVAAAAAWEALVEVHAGHALQFIALMSAHLDFDDAVDRYLDSMDVAENMAAAVRSRVLIALEHALSQEADRPKLDGLGGVPETAGSEEEEDDGDRGLRRFRPDLIMKGIVRKVRESEAQDEWVRLALARAEEAVIRAHVDNAVVFAAILRDHEAMNDAVDDYLELLRVSGGRAQSVHQRAMARLAELHLPAMDDEDGPGKGTADG